MKLQGWHRWRPRNRRFGSFDWIWGAPHELHGYNYGLHFRRGWVADGWNFCVGPLYGFVMFPRIWR